MHPIFFTWHNIHIHWYSVLLFFSIVIGLIGIINETKRRGLSTKYLLEGYLIVLWAALLGGKFAGLLLSYINQTFTPDMFQIFNAKTSMVLYGGIIFGGISAILYCSWRKEPFLKHADVSAPYLALGISFSRIGCFLNGCCFGRAIHTDVIWTIHFPNDCPAGNYQEKIGAIGLFPSQIAEAIGSFIIFIILLQLKQSKHHAGIKFYLFLVLIALQRFLSDFGRYYDSHEKFGGLSYNQIISVSIFIISLSAILIKKRQDLKASI